MLSLELAAIIQYIDLEDMTDSSVKSMLSVQQQQKKKNNKQLTMFGDIWIKLVFVDEV